MLTLNVFCFIGRDNDHFTGGKYSVLAKSLWSRVLSLLRVIPAGAELRLVVVIDPKPWTRSAGLGEKGHGTKRFGRSWL
jgi:hypothetical protein